MDLALRALRRNHHRKLLRIIARFCLSLHVAAAAQGSLLHVAVARDKFESARALLQAGAPATSTASTWKQTPLHLVRSVRVAELLIANGADVNAIADRIGCAGKSRHNTHTRAAHTHTHAVHTYIHTQGTSFALTCALTYSYLQFM